jgi:hypothetical protein
MEFQAYDIALIPIVVAIVGIISALGIPSKYLPICSIILGVLIGVVYVAPEAPQQAILSGIVIGLSAIGVHSGVKNTINKPQ